MLAERAQIAFQIIGERFFAGTVAWHGRRWTAETMVVTAEATAHAAAETAAAHAHAAAETAAHTAARPARDGAVWTFLPEEATLFSVFLVP